MEISLLKIVGAALTIGVRVTGLLLFAPFFGSVAIPPRIKAVLVLFKTAVMNKTRTALIRGGMATLPKKGANSNSPVTRTPMVSAAPTILSSEISITVHTHESQKVIAG